MWEVVVRVGEIGLVTVLEGEGDGATVMVVMVVAAGIEVCLLELEVLELKVLEV